MLLGCSEEFQYSGGPQAHQSIFGLLGVKNLDLLISRKRLFRVLPSLENSFYDIRRQKISLGRDQENDFSRRKLAWNSHFCLQISSKYTFDMVANSLIYGFNILFEIIFGLL
jgi:hypothetical protein